LSFLSSPMRLTAMSTSYRLRSNPICRHQNPSYRKPRQSRHDPLSRFTQGFHISISVSQEFSLQFRLGLSSSAAFGGGGILSNQSLDKPLRLPFGTHPCVDKRLQQWNLWLSRLISHMTRAPSDRCQSVIDSCTTSDGWTIATENLDFFSPSFSQPDSWRSGISFLDVVGAPHSRLTLCFPFECNKGLLVTVDAQHFAPRLDCFCNGGRIVGRYSALLGPSPFLGSASSISVHIQLG